MKKLGRRLLILLIIGGVLYGAYYFFVRPTGFTSKSELARSYFTSIHEPTVCEDHFQVETVSFCETFASLFDGETLVIDSVTETSQTANVTITIDDTTETFEVSFIRTTVTGLRGFLNGYTYTIDTIQ